MAINKDLLLFKSLLSIDKNKAFDFIYKQYYSLLIFIASSYLKNKEDILDIVQTSFLSFFDSYKTVDNVKTYLVITCKNNCLNFLKKNKYLSNLDDIEGLSSSDNMLGHIAYIDLIDKLDQIVGLKTRKIITMHLIDDLSFKEIAKKFNEKEKTIKTQYYRGLKKAKKDL